MRGRTLLIGVCLAVVVIGLGLRAALALPTMATELPRTVEEQAEWMGDFWAAWLIEDCGDALPLEAIAGPREELVEGLKARLREPLSIQYFDMVSGCMMGGVDGYTASRPPHELEVRRDVRRNLYNLDWFLSHPPDVTGEARGVSEDPSLQVWREVGGQVAELFYLLQRDLIADLAPRTEDPEAAAKTIAGAVFLSGHQLVLVNLLSPTTRVFKRALTVEEMEGLRERVREIVQLCGENFGQDMGLEFGQAIALRHEAGPAASSLATAMQRVYWNERPPMLSRQEQEALDEALAARAEQRRQQQLDRFELLSDE